MCELDAQRRRSWQSWQCQALNGACHALAKLGQCLASGALGDAAKMPAPPGPSLRLLPVELESDGKAIASSSLADGTLAASPSSDCKLMASSETRPESDSLGNSMTDWAAGATLRKRLRRPRTAMARLGWRSTGPCSLGLWRRLHAQTVPDPCGQEDGLLGGTGRTFGEPEPKIASNAKTCRALARARHSRGDAWQTNAHLLCYN